MSMREIIAYLMILVVVVSITAVYLRLSRRRRAYQKAYRKYEADRRIHGIRRFPQRRNR